MEERNRAIKLNPKTSVQGSVPPYLQSGVDSRGAARQKQSRRRPAVGAAPPAFLRHSRAWLPRGIAEGLCRLSNNSALKAAMDFQPVLERVTSSPVEPAPPHP